ncbi:MAG: hypothetical protein J6X00_03575 [Clostridia bacterium]|nr:hypothetical protein [Clostridia bacterium]
MKKFKTLSVILFGMLATVLLGACSCSTKTGNIAVHVVTAQVEAGAGVEIVDDSHILAVEGSTITLSYEIKPAEASNTKVTFSTSDSSIIKVEGNTSTTGATGTGTFKVLEYNELKHEDIKIRVTTDDGGYTAAISVDVQPNPEALNKVTGLKYNFTTNRIEWDAVTGASKYAVSINGEEYITTSNFYTGTLDGQLPLVAGVEYDVKVLAKGDTVHYKDAEEFSDHIAVYILETPTISSVSNGVMTWDEVEDAVAYTVYINNEHVDQNATTIDLKNQYELLSANREFAVNIVATSDRSSSTVFYVPSAKSETRRITWLAAPVNIRLNSERAVDTVAIWDRVTNASAYNVEIDSVNSNESTEAYTIPTAFEAGAYTMTIQAMGNEETTISDSHSVATFDFTKLDNVALEVNDSKLIVDKSTLIPLVENPEDVKNFIYELYFIQGGNVVKTIRLTEEEKQNNLTHDLSESVALPNGGTYSVYARVLAVNNTKFASAILNTQPTSTAFTKLNYTTIQEISNVGVIKFASIANMAPSDTSNYIITIDNNEIVLSTLSDNVTTDGGYTYIDLNIDDTTSMHNLVAGAHTVKVVPRSTNYVKSTESRCNIYNFTKLAALSNYNLDNASSTLSWANVTNATGYVLNVNGANKNLNTTSYKVLDSELLDGENSFSIVAVGNNVKFVNSEPYEFNVSRLNTVANLRVEDGVLTWDPVDGVDYYINTYNSSSTTPSSTRKAESNIIKEFSGSVSLTLYTSKEGFFNSSLTPKFRLTRLAKPTNIALTKGVDNVVSFDAVDNATGYVLNITHGEQSNDYTLDASTLSYTLPSVLEGGSYVVTVYAIGDDDIDIEQGTTAYITGKLSDEYTIIKLATPTITKTGGAAQWQIGAGAVPGKYELVFVGSALPTQTIDAITISGSYTFATYADTLGNMLELPAGDYTFTVQAFASTSASGSNVIDSDVSQQVSITKFGKVQPVANDGVISFDNLGATIEYQYSSDGVFTSSMPNNNNSGITINTAGSISTVQINTQRVTQGYLRFIAIASDGYATGSFGDPIHFEQLPATLTFTKSTTTLSWSEISGATRYVVRNVTTSSPVIITEVPSGTHSVTIQNPTGTGIHKYDVYAIGSTYTTAQITPSTVIYIQGRTKELEVAVLNEVANLTLDHGVLRWSAYPINGVDEPNYLQLIIEDNESNTLSKRLNATDTSFDLNTAKDTHGDPLASGVAYKVSLQYFGSGDYSLDGGVHYYTNPNTGSQIIKKYVSPTPSVTAGRLEYSLVDGLSGANNVAIARRVSGSSLGYTDLVRGSDYTIEFGNGGKNYVNLIFPQKDLEYELVFKTVAPIDGLNSEYGNPFTVAQYSTPTQFKIQEGLFSWYPVAHGQSYLIEAVEENGVYVISTAVDGKESAHLKDPDNPSEYLDLSGAYYFRIMARGTQTYESGTAYINSEYSDSIRVTYVGNVENINVSQNTLSWDAIGGVEFYDVELRNSGSEILQSYRTASNSVSIDIFASKLAQGANNIFSVKAVTTTDDSYIMTSTASSNSVSLYQAPKITNLRVINGEFAWSIDMAAFKEYYIARGGDIANIVQLIKDLANNQVSSQDDIERYKPFYAFTINLNGTLINLDPTTTKRYTSYEVDITDPLNPVVTFFYGIETNVTSYTDYTISVRSMGNSATQEDAEKPGTAAIPMIIASGYSESLTAVKVPSPQTTVLQDGKLTFALLVAPSSLTYVKDYIITARPDSSSSSSVDPKEIHLTDEDLARLSPSYQYTYDLSPNNVTWLSKNTSYSITVTSLGTLDSTTLATGQTVYLRSSNYMTKQVNFLDDIDAIIYNDSQDAFGGYLSWENPLGISQDVYFVRKAWYEANAVDSHGDQLPLEAWLVEGNFGLDSIIYFEYIGRDMTFTAPIADVNGDLVDLPVGDYYVGIRLKGNGRNLIASDNIIFQGNEFSKLGAATKYDGRNTWINDGKFRWNPVDNTNEYKVVLAEYTMAGQLVNEYQFEVVIGDTIYSVPEDIGTYGNKFKLKITPLGRHSVDQYSNEKYFLSGNTIETDFYSLLPAPELLFDQDENIVSWGRDTTNPLYEIVINSPDPENPGSEIENILSRYQYNSYDLDDFNGGQGLIAGRHSLKIKAISTSDNFLNSKYSITYTIVKLEDPTLWIETVADANLQGENHVRPGAVIVWRSANETLLSGKTIVKAYVTDEQGTYDPTLDTPILDTWFNSSVRYYDTSNVAGFNAGRYYTFVVKFANGDDYTSEITLASGEAKMTIYKSAAPVPALGRYYSPDVPQAERESSFTNYIKWPLLTYGESGQTDFYEEQNYIVRVYDSSTLGNLLISWNTVTVAHQSLFEIQTIDGVRTMCFDLSGLLTLASDKKDNVWIQVAGIGEASNVDMTSIGHPSTDYSGALNVQVPVNKPIVTSTADELSKGIIKWNNEYNCNVEIVLDYKYKAYNESEYRDLTYIEQLTNIPTEYHLPFVSNNYTIKLRYVQSGFASPYSDTITSAIMTMFASGAGTESDPYIIYDNSPDDANETRNKTIYTQLQNIAYYPNAYFSLERDFSLPSTYTWEMLDFEFGGTFDGNLHNMSNMKLPDSSAYSAIFRKVSSTGTIKDLSITYANILSGTSSTTASIELAGVVYENYGTLYNVNLGGTFTVDYTNYNIKYAGVAFINHGTITKGAVTIAANLRSNASLLAAGVAYNNYGTISSISVNGSLRAVTVGSSSSSVEVGGVVYNNAEGASIVNVKVHETITSNNIGGVAYNNSGLIETTGFYGSITASEYSEDSQRNEGIWVGGIVANNFNNGSIQACFAVFTENTLNITIASTSNRSAIAGVIANIERIDTGDTPYMKNVYVSIKATINGTPHIMANLIGNGNALSRMTISDCFYYAINSYQVFGTSGGHGATPIAEGQTSVPAGLNSGFDTSIYRFIENPHYHETWENPQTHEIEPYITDTYDCPFVISYTSA